MEPRIGTVVRSLAGHDKDGLFFVVGLEESSQRLLLVNGKQRRMAAPKGKRLRHVQILDQGSFEHPVIGKLKHGEPVSDRELRKALAAFKEENTLG